MSEYAELVQRLRGKKLNCTCAAKSASECCCDTDWPESSCNEAADAIELLQRELKCANELWEQQKELALEYLADIEKANKRIEELEVPLCIGQRTIGIMAEEGCWKSEDGRAVVAADELFRQDPYARIAELEAALKRVLEDIADYERVNNLYTNPRKEYWWESVRAARKVLREKE